MTPQEFWNKYINENILDIFDITCDFFSGKLPGEFLKKYDVGEVILETVGHHAKVKEFERVLKFLRLLKDKQPELYMENFQYLDDFLVDFYCFHRDHKQVEAAFANFINYPVQDYDQYFSSFKKLLFYQYTDLIDRAITENFDTVAGSNKLIGAPEYDLAICKLYSELEVLWEKNSNVFPKKRIDEVMERYGFDPDQILLSTIEQCIFSDVCDRESLERIFIEDKRRFRFMLQWHFMKYMKNKGVSFALSGRIFEKMLGYWEGNIKKKKRMLDLYFRVHPQKFEKHMVDLSGDMFYDNKPEMVAVLWGCVYIYDFLRSIELISQKTYDDLLEQSRRLKGIVIGQFVHDLWDYDFVHTWGRPGNVSETEFEEEHKIFRKSYSFKRDGFGEFRKEISAELIRIGELAGYIIEGGKQDKKGPDLSALEDLFDTPGEYEELQENFDEIDEYEGSQENIDDTDEYEGSQENIDDTDEYEPTKSWPKVGRNEPCPCGSGKKYKKCCL